MKRSKHPKVVVLAGPNGAGKSTSAQHLLRGPLGVPEFVNADVIAQGLSGFSPQGVAVQAGRIMLARLRTIARERKNFAFETTLASRSFAPFLQKLRAAGYEVHLVFLWLPDPDAAVARVAERVAMGGHDVPEETIRRRYFAGIKNFFELYQPLATTWQLVDNSEVGRPRIVATGRRVNVGHVHDEAEWQKVREAAKQS